MTTLDLSPLEKALAALQRALARAKAAPEDEELRDACIQRFECTFELAWKMLRRRLWLDLPSADELEGASYRTLIRIAARQGLIDDVAAWLVFRDKRNITSHTYDEKKAHEVYAVIPSFACAAEALLGRLRERGAQDARARARGAGTHPQHPAQMAAGATGAGFRIPRDRAGAALLRPRSRRHGRRAHCGRNLGRAARGFRRQPAAHPCGFVSLARPA